MGIGTLILTKGVIAAYVKAIIDRVYSGMYGTKLTFKDTEDIYETLAYLRDNYDGDSDVCRLLSFAASMVKMVWEAKRVVSTENDFYHCLLCIKNQLAD